MKGIALKKSLLVWLFVFGLILAFAIIGYQGYHTKNIRVYAVRMVSCLQGTNPSFKKDPECHQWVKKAEMQNDGVVFYSQDYNLILTCKLNLSANNVKCMGKPSDYFMQNTIEIPIATLTK